MSTLPYIILPKETMGLCYSKQSQLASASRRDKMKKKEKKKPQWSMSTVQERRRYDPKGHMPNVAFVDGNPWVLRVESEYFEEKAMKSDLVVKETVLQMSWWRDDLNDELYVFDRTSHETRRKLPNLPPIPPVPMLNDEGHYDLIDNDGPITQDTQPVFCVYDYEISEPIRKETAAGTVDDMHSHPTLTNTDRDTCEETDEYMNAALQPIPSNKDKDADTIQCFEYEEMIKIFQPLIVGNVIVREILPYLPFIDDHDDIYKAESYSRRKAINVLLDQIFKSQEVGKWQKFITALSDCGYQYIVQNIKGYRLINQRYQKEYLKTLTPKFSKQINATELLSHLVAKNVLGDNDKEEIEQEVRNKGKIAAAVLLLDRIPRKHTYWYTKFIEALNETNRDDLAKDLAIPNLLQPSFDGNGKEKRRLPRTPLPGRVCYRPSATGCSSGVLSASLHPPLRSYRPRPSMPLLQTDEEKPPPLPPRIPIIRPTLRKSVPLNLDRSQYEEHGGLQSFEVSMENARQTDMQYDPYSTYSQVKLLSRPPSPPPTTRTKKKMIKESNVIKHDIVKVDEDEHILSRLQQMCSDNPRLTFSDYEYDCDSDIENDSDNDIKKDVCDEINDDIGYEPINNNNDTNCRKLSNTKTIENTLSNPESSLPIILNKLKQEACELTNEVHVLEETKTIRGTINEKLGRKRQLCIDVDILEKEYNAMKLALDMDASSVHDNTFEPKPSSAFDMNTTPATKTRLHFTGPDQNSGDVVHLDLSALDIYRPPSSDKVYDPSKFGTQNMWDTDSAINLYTTDALK